MGIGPLDPSDLLVEGDQLAEPPPRATPLGQAPVARYSIGGVGRRGRFGKPVLRPGRAPRTRSATTYATRWRPSTRPMVRTTLIRVGAAQDGGWIQAVDHSPTIHCRLFASPLRRHSRQQQRSAQCSRGLDKLQPMSSPRLHRIPSRRPSGTAKSRNSNKEAINPTGSLFFSSSPVSGTFDNLAYESYTGTSRRV